MKKRITTFFAGGLLALALIGATAYRGGDYALQLPLAELGNAAAQYKLGVMYDQGQGVPQDYAQALSWYRKAADQEYAIAQMHIGSMYYDGRGVPKDHAQAHMWFNLAASRATDAETRDIAAKDRDDIAAKMTPDQIAEAQRMVREWAPK